jgi:hypothetical protein
MKNKVSEKWDNMIKIAAFFGISLPKKPLFWGNSGVGDGG